MATSEDLESGVNHPNLTEIRSHPLLEPERIPQDQQNVGTAVRRSSTISASDDYEFPQVTDNLDEVTAPSPVQNREENVIGRREYLEEKRTESHSRRDSIRLDRLSHDGRARTSQEVIAEPTLAELETSRATRTRGYLRRKRVSKFATELYTTSYLVLFSFIGTLCRLVLEHLTFYPGAPVTTSVVWANFAGTLLMGFFSENRELFCGDDEKELNATFPDSDDEIGRQDTPKKPMPLYIGLTTGFCSSLTSFSSFLRDAFLTIFNDLSSPLGQISSISLYAAASPDSKPPNGGYNFMAVIAVCITEIILSLGALFLGAHIAIFTSKWIPRVPSWFTRKVLDPFVVVAASLLWVAIICLAALLPHSTRDHSIWSQEIWRGPALYALAFSPVGCLARFYISVNFNGQILSFPLGTFISNAGGTAILGMSFALQHAKIAPADVGGGGYLGCQILQGIMDGFCGCMTTVSTWVLELSDLRRAHAYIYGFVSVAVSLIVLVVVIGSLKWAGGFVTPVCFS